MKVSFHDIFKNDSKFKIFNSFYEVKYHNSQLSIFNSQLNTGGVYFGKT